MGLNQHLVRSILAIRDQGGVALPNGDRVMPDPILVGRNAEKVAALAQAIRHRALDHRSRRGAEEPERHGVLRRRDHADARRPASPARSRPASTSIARSRSRTRSTRRSRWRSSPSRSGVKHGVVQDKLFLPGLRKIAMLREAGFFGRMLRGARRVRLLGVRGRLGPAGAAPELELQEGRGRRHHPRHAVPLALRARQPVRRRAGGELPRRDAHPEPRRRERQDLHGRHRRRRLRDLPARRRRDRAHQLVLGDAAAARRPRHLPGRRHARLGGRRPDALL